MTYRPGDALPWDYDALLANRGLGFTPALVVDGATDNTAAITNAFAISKVVRLPAGSIKANITIPTGCTLIGAGKLTWDRVSAWVGTGTLILGLVTMTGSTDVQASDFSIDNYASGADAIDIKSDASRRIQVRRVSTRANNHNVLCEKNLTGDATNDKIGAVFNNILFEDCEFNGGPNGLAVKMRGVIVRRCVAYDITGQAYPVVSDNINGSAIYSRAQDVLFEDCDALNCAEIWHVYSRDCSSTNNAAGVLGAKNIVWRGGRIAGALSNRGAQIGDDVGVESVTGQYPNGQTRIANIGVWIFGALVADNSQAGLAFQNINGGGYANLTFDNNGTAGGGIAGVGVQVASTGCSNIEHGQNIVLSGAGLETKSFARQASATLTSGVKGIVQNNYLAAGTTTLTLPAPAVGDEYSFYVNTAQTMTIVSGNPGVNAMRDGATFASISSIAPGSFLRVKALPNISNVLQWIVTDRTGTWTTA